MKKLLYLFACVAVLGFFSCSKDDDPKNDDNNNNKTDLFYVPTTQWGANKKTVKSYMSGYTLTEETDEDLYYNGKGVTDEYYYEFYNDALDASVVSIFSNQVDTNELVAFILRDYKPYGEDEDDENILYFISSNYKTFMALEVYYSDYNKQVMFALTYVPFGDSTRAGALQNIKKVSGKVVPADKGNVESDVINKIKAAL